MTREEVLERLPGSNSVGGKVIHRHDGANVVVGHTTSDGAFHLSDEGRALIQAPVAEAPVAEAPVAEAPVAEAPVAEAPVAEAPVAAAPVAEAHEVAVEDVTQDDIAALLG